MEERIKLITSTSFNLSEDEITRFYTVMAFLQYHHQRKPEYIESALLRRLSNDFARLNKEIGKVCENDPNNLRLISSICKILMSKLVVVKKLRFWKTKNEAFFLTLR